MSGRGLRLPPVHGRKDQAAPSPELAALLHVWDAKLAQSGLPAIEHRHPNGTLDLAKLDGANPERNYSRKLQDRRAEYYHRAEVWLVTKPSGWRRDIRGRRVRTRGVWRLHSQGARNTEIARQLQLSPQLVAEIIRREQAAMRAWHQPPAVERGDPAIIKPYRAVWEHAPPGAWFPGDGGRTPVRNSGYGSDAG